MSLLTQFYPGPGSGGGDITTAFGGLPVITLLGVVGAVPSPGPTGWLPWLNGYVSQSSSSSNFSVDYSPTTSAGTQIDKLIIANTVVTSTPTADLKAIKVYLNGAAWAVNPTASQTKTTSITGTGVLSIRGTWPALTTIGTDLAITPEGNTTVNVSAPLDAASVNHILISLADNGYAAGTDARTINLAGNPACAGSGALTVAGNAARTALVAANWTVTLNP